MHRTPEQSVRFWGIGLEFAIFWLELRYFLPYSPHFLSLRRNLAVRAT